MTWARAARNRFSHVMRTTITGRRIRRILRPAPLATHDKNGITSALGRWNRLRTYLEITSPTAGLKFRHVDRDNFLSARRLVYHCPDGTHRDGFEIDFAIPEFDIAPTLARIAREGPVPQVILVDSYHTYDISLRDMEAALDLIPEGGFVVVHDCLPTKKHLCTPHYIEGPWFGVSYAAFLDLVLTREGIDYLTVDCDVGCGVIAKGRRMRPARGNPHGPLPPRPDPALRRRWLDRDRDDHDAAWELFAARNADLLRAVPPEAFFAGLSVAPIKDGA